jgi:predicted nucleic acid-binding protein
VKTVYLDTNVILKLFFEEDLGREQAEAIALLAKQNKVKIAISQWVINECVAAVQRKKNKRKMTARNASEILTGIANMIEGKIEDINLSLYPITERVIDDSRTTVMETECETAGDALHVCVADKAKCDYFVTADKPLYDSLRNCSVNRRLIPLYILCESDMLILASL